MTSSEQYRAEQSLLLSVCADDQRGGLSWLGLGIFGFVFAVDSSVHSYLILAYAGSAKAAEDVGFYYAANALGRLLGTLFSGLLYQWGGLMCSLIGSAVMLITCWIITLMLPARVDALPPPLSSDVRPIGETQ